MQIFFYFLHRNIQKIRNLCSEGDKIDMDSVQWTDKWGIRLFCALTKQHCFLAQVVYLVWNVETYAFCIQQVRQMYALGSWNFCSYTRAHQIFLIDLHNLPLKHVGLHKELKDMGSSLHLQENHDKRVASLFLRKIKQCHVSTTRGLIILLSLLTLSSEGNFM